MSIHAIVELRKAYASDSTIATGWDDEQYWYLLGSTTKDRQQRIAEFCEYLWDEGVLNEEPWQGNNGDTYVGYRRVSQCDGKRIVLFSEEE